MVVTNRHKQANAWPAWDPPRSGNDACRQSPAQAAQLLLGASGITSVAFEGWMLEAFLRVTGFIVSPERTVMVLLLPVTTA